MEISKYLKLYFVDADNQTNGEVGTSQTEQTQHSANDYTPTEQKNMNQSNDTPGYQSNQQLNNSGYQPNQPQNIPAYHSNPPSSAAGYQSHPPPTGTSYQTVASKIQQVMREVTALSNGDRDTNSPRTSSAPNSTQNQIPVYANVYPVSAAMGYRPHPNPNQPSHHALTSHNQPYVPTSPAQFGPGFVPIHAGHVYSSLAQALDPGDQPIDYSIKYQEQSLSHSGDVDIQPPADRLMMPPPQRRAPPVQPRFQNYIGNRFNSPMPVYNNRPRLVAGHFVRPGSRQMTPRMAPPPQQLGPRMAPPPQQLGAYAETDLDCDDQITDFSTRYSERPEERFTNQRPANSMRYVYRLLVLWIL